MILIFFTFFINIFFFFVRKQKTIDLKLQYGTILFAGLYAILKKVVRLGTKSGSYNYFEFFCNFFFHFCLDF